MDIEATLDGQGQTGNTFRIYYMGRIWDVYHSPLGGWCVWDNTPYKHADGLPTYDSALDFIANIRRVSSRSGIKAEKR